jgi:hypothetical protein
MTVTRNDICSEQKDPIRNNSCHVCGSAMSVDKARPPLPPFFFFLREITQSEYGATFDPVLAAEGFIHKRIQYKRHLRATQCDGIYTKPPHLHHQLSYTQ